MARPGLVVALFAVLLVGGCMPVAGPESWDVRSQAHDHGGTDDRLPYALVKLSPQVMSVLARHGQGFYGTFSDRRPPKEITFGIGDTVGVTIFEAAAGGLFIPSEAGVRPGNFVQLPNQDVDNNGNISVPYAGAVRASGRTPTEVQQSVVNALKN